MIARQKFVMFGIGIFIWVNVLTIALSTWRFGYVDVRTVAQMGLIALPPLIVGAFLLARPGAGSRLTNPELPGRATVAVRHAR
ncbi:MAG TPA: hypothetical protein VEC38_02370 [Candidatus Binataceae bacterium]|nr:hypothetical protein [Candidatus Binataceae bacterium]